MNFASIVNVFKSENRAAVSWASVDALDIMGRGKVKAGQKVTPETALTIMAVYAAVRIIAEGMASLPVKAYREVANAPREMANAPDWLEDPNAALALTKQDLISQMLVSLLLRGNAYVFALKVAGSLAIESLEVLDPDTVDVKREGGRIVYTINGRPYGPDEILHVRGLTLPGELKGLDPISYAAATLGTGIAAQEYGASFMANASLPGGFIMVPGNLSETAAKLIRRGWDRLHSGAENAGKVAVLTEGAEFKPISLTPEQTQFLEVRSFTVQDVARLFGMPPHLLADSSNSTSWGSGLAEQNTAFSKMTLSPWAGRLETGLTKLLRSESFQARKKHYVKLHLEGFERGSYKERFETYAIGIASGIYTEDEVRAWEDLPPLTDEQRKAKASPPAPQEDPVPPATPESEGDSDDTSEEDDS